MRAIGILTVFLGLCACRASTMKVDVVTLACGPWTGGATVIAQSVSRYDNPVPLMNQAARSICKRGFDRINERISNNGSDIQWYIQCHGDFLSAAELSQTRCGGAAPKKDS